MSSLQLADQPPHPLSIEGRAFRAGRRAEAGSRRRQAPAAAFTAAAQILELGSPREQAAIKRGQRPEQKAAWDFHDALGMLRQGARFKSRAMGKLRLYAAVRTSETDDPVPVDSTDEAGGALVPPALAAAAADALDRLGQARGGLPAHQARWGSNGFVAGEAFLVGYPDRSSPTGEAFYMASRDELRITSRDQWALVPDPDVTSEQDWIVLPEAESLVLRIWNQHPRYGARADSSVIGALGLCEHLLLLQNEAMGVALSRLNAGVMLFTRNMLGMPGAAGSQGTDQPPAAGTEGQAALHPIIRGAMEHFMAPIANPRSAAVAVPFMLWGDKEDIEAWRWEFPERAFDEVSLEQMDRVLRRIANDVDLPSEVLLGTMAEANHWTAWLISDDTFRAYVQPDTEELCTALTAGYLHADLIERGFNPDEVRRLVVWYDESELVADPDETETVFKATEAGIIGTEPARRRLGFAETEAPTPEDIELLRRRTGRGGDAPAEGRPPVQEDAEPAPEPDAEAVAAAALVPERAAPVVDLQARRLQALADRLVDRDRNLRNRLVAQADAGLHRALDRAGARLRNRASSQVQRDVLRPHANRLVASVLGRHLATAALTAASDEEASELLLAGAFDDVVARFRSQVGRAQAATRRELADLGVPEAELAQLEADQAEHLDRGAEVLLAGLLQLATSLLWDPTPATPDGEYDPTVDVPPGLLRHALAVAGGANGHATAGGAVISAVDGHVAGGVAAGDRTLQALRTVGIVPEAYRWNYGDPATRGSSFEPHLSLDGVVFTTWTSDRLATGGGWPHTETGGFMPGDHQGCDCDVYPVLVQRS